MSERKILILFDIDGTLIKFKSGTAGKIFSDIMEEIFNVRIDKNNLPDFAGQTDLKILREICEINNIPFSSVQSHIELIWEKMLHLFGKYCTPKYILLLDGVPELLDFLSKEEFITLGLLTGNFRENAYQKLKTYNLHSFFRFGAFGSDEEDRNKLPPLAIKRANSLFEVEQFSNENTIIIGDAPRDITCARANNIKVASVTTGGYNISELETYSPDLIFENFSDYRSVSLSLCNLIN
jgi:phosphoglycolate phosphatase-like HAD superfamily hydrolase